MNKRRSFLVSVEEGKPPNPMAVGQAVMDEVMGNNENPEVEVTLIPPEEAADLAELLRREGPGPNISLGEAAESLADALDPEPSA